MNRFTKIKIMVLSNKLIKGSVVIFIGNMMANISSYAYHLLIGRILGPQSYGELAALLSLFYIVNVPSEVIRQFLVKYFSITKANNNKAQAKYIFLKATKYLTVVTILGGFVLIPFVDNIAKYLHLSSWYPVLWLYLIFATFFLTMINATALQGYQLFLQSTIYTNILAIFRLMLGAIAAFWGVQWTLIGNVLSNTLGYIIHFLPVKFILKEKEEKFILTKKEAVNYGLPVFLSTLGMTLLFSQDVVLVKHFFSPFEAGIYSSLAVLGKVIFFASSAISVAIFPVVAEKKELGKNTFSIVLGGAFLVALVSFLVTLLYFLFPHYVVLALFGESYTQAVGLVGYFGIFLSFYSIASMLTSSCLAIGITNVWFFPILASTSQYIVINYFSHEKIINIIINNIIISGILVIFVLLYYLYAKNRT